VVKRVSGVDFDVRFAPRRAGDPAALVAKVDRIRALGWAPQHDDLEEIVDQALRWERELAERKAA
jgi:UDP-glucose 4-epimerase